MKIRWRHRWDLTPAEARAVQTRGVRRHSLTTGLDIKKFAREGCVAAADVAYDKNRRMCFAAVVLWNLRFGGVHDTWTHAAPATFPYVPGLLSFREIPPLIPIFDQINEAWFDVILCDGQGYAHPRRFGLAAHLGVLYDKPSLGWAKSRLIGEYDEPRKSRGAASPLVDGEEQIGWVLRSRAACEPSFISPGHRLSMDDSLQLARLLMGKYRLCEPARVAHQLTGIAMRA